MDEKESTMDGLKARRAVESDIPTLDKLLYEVHRVHSDARPDLFRKGTKKYTDEELKEILRDENRPILAAVDDNDCLQGYAFCIFQ